MKPLLIVGASGRAAAAAMLRRGFSPIVFDSFADLDTQRLADTIRCDSFDDVLVDPRHDGVHWMYVGGIENVPDVIARISERHPLIGNASTVVNQVRAPFLLSQAVHELGGKMPRMSRTPGGSGRWLRKRFVSAGGLGVTPFNDDLESGEFLQEHLPGTPVSAVFEDETLLGVTRQLCGQPWLHADAFHYCGNLRDDANPHRGEFARLGRAFAERFSLKGFWGLDAIQNDAGLHILEINPRYTASMELFDHPPAGKAVYYAPHDLQMPPNGPWDESLSNCRNVSVLHSFADITPPGVTVKSGVPLISLFAAGGSPELCLLKLQQQARELDLYFGAR